LKSFVQSIGVQFCRKLHAGGSQSWNEGRSEGNSSALHFEVVTAGISTSSTTTCPVYGRCIGREEQVDGC